MENYNKELIAIYIPNEEAKKFLVFQQYYDTFTIMLDSGVFDIRNGSAVLNFDSAGVLQVIQRADNLYSRKHKVI